MSYMSKPVSQGIYRIKVSGKDLYIESDPGPNACIRLATLDAASSKQKWDIKVSQNTDAYTITSVYDSAGLSYYKTSHTYGGYGYPLPQNGTSINWVISEAPGDSERSSKIMVHGDCVPIDCCDSDLPNAVHFYSDESDHIQQRYVFEPVKIQGQ